MKKIIAIIPTHGAGQAFIDCIESLTKQTQPLAKIIVIDNNSHDGAVQQAKVQFPQIEVFSLLDNRGVTGGRNAGIQHLPPNYDAALFVDHDMIAQPDMLSELINTLERHPHAGIVTPKIYYFSPKDIIWSAGTDVNLATGQTIFYGGKDKGQYDLEKAVAVAPATFLVKKAVIESVGGFDDKYFATYEDTDFCFAAKKAGFETWYSPKAVSYHKLPYDPQAAMHRLLERTYYVARNRILFMRKYAPNYLKFLLFVPIYFLYYVFLALKYQKYYTIIQYLRGVYDGLRSK